MTPLPPPETIVVPWTAAAKVVGVFLGVILSAIALWKAFSVGVTALLEPHRDRRVMAALDRSRSRLREIIEDEFSEELDDMRHVSETAKRNTEALTTIKDALRAQGELVKDVPKMSDAVNRLSGTLDSLAHTLDAIRDDSNVMKGYMKARDPDTWHEEERRVMGDRRVQDSPIDFPDRRRASERRGNGASGPGGGGVG